MPMKADTKRPEGHFFFIFHSLSFFSHFMLFILILFYFFGKIKTSPKQEITGKNVVNLKVIKMGLILLYSFFLANSP